MDENAGNTAIDTFDALWDVRFGPVVVALVVALALSAGLWAFNNYLLPIFTRDLNPKRVARFRQRVTVGAWFGYFLLLIYWSLQAAPMISTIIFGLALAVGWKLWRDMVEGAIFKLQARAGIGDLIAVGDEEGVIEKVGLRHLSIRTVQEKQLFVPYSELSRAAWQKAAQRSQLKSRSFELQLASGSVAHADDIRKSISQCPWTVANRTPEVVSIFAGRYKVEATTLDQQTFEYLVEFLKKRFS